MQHLMDTHGSLLKLSHGNPALNHYSLKKAKYEQDNQFAKIFGHCFV